MKPVSARNLVVLAVSSCIMALATGCICLKWWGPRNCETWLPDLELTSVCVVPSGPDITCKASDDVPKIKRGNAMYISDVTVNRNCDTACQSIVRLYLCPKTDPLVIPANAPMKEHDINALRKDQKCKVTVDWGANQPTGFYYVVAICGEGVTEATGAGGNNTNKCLIEITDMGPVTPGIDSDVYARENATLNPTHGAAGTYTWVTDVTTNKEDTSSTYCTSQLYLCPSNTVPDDTVNGNCTPWFPHGVSAMNGFGSVTNVNYRKIPTGLGNGNYKVTTVCGVSSCSEINDAARANNTNTIAILTIP